MKIRLFTTSPLFRYKDLVDSGEDRLLKDSYSIPEKFKLKTVLAREKYSEDKQYIDYIEVDTLEDLVDLQKSIDEALILQPNTLTKEHFKSKIPKADMELEIYNGYH